MTTKTTTETCLLTEVPESENIGAQRLFSQRADGLSFLECMEAALRTPEMVQQIDRLYGTTLVSRATPIERMVDEATGKQDADIQTFLRFVWNCVFIRVPALKSASK